MKKMIALLLALVMAFALVACGGQENNQTSGNEEGSDKILIGAIYRDLTQTWFEKESTAAKDTADELGIDILIGDGQEDPAVLIDVLDSFITQGIQGLVINTCDQGLSQTILDKIFSMTMLVTLNEEIATFNQVQEKLSAVANELGVQAIIQRQDVFDAMYSI